MEACSSQTSVDFQRTTWRCVQEDVIIHTDVQQWVLVKVFIIEITTG
jgi:hypothetical protein